MKKTRIISLILALAMMLGVLSVLPVSAEEAATSKAVEILAQNVVYGEKVQIAYAVDVTLEEAESVTVEYYLESDPSKVYTASLLDTSNPDNIYNATNPAFATLGFHATDFTDVVYATAYIGDKAPENAVYKRYSVAEYFYSKLYKDGFINKTLDETDETTIEETKPDSDRKNLYLSMIDYGKYAQEVLVNNKGGNETLITDYCYLFAADNTVTINGEKSGLFKPGTTVTFAATSNVSAYILTDKTGAESGASAAYTTVAGYVAKVTPDLGTSPVVTDFETGTLPASPYITHYDKDNNAIDYENQDPTTYSTLSIVDDPTGAVNKVLMVDKLPDDNGNYTIKTRVTASNTQQTGSCVTLEFKMYSTTQIQYDSNYIDFYFTNDSGAEAKRVGFLMYQGTQGGSNWEFREDNKSGSGSGTVVNADGTYEGYTEGSSLRVPNPDGAVTKFKTNVPSADWVDFKIEFYEGGTLSSYTKVWINGELVADGVYHNASVNYNNFAYVQFRHHSKTRNEGITYFDDISVTLTDKAYVPETTTAE